tara:strand:+ start:37393 stop:37881 length:489 start_codon:yes stop_codon:yes gene_type:complete
MNQYDAFKILGLSGQLTNDDIKLAYRRACKAYHPDRNPAGLEMMQLVNAAYEVVKDFTGEADVSADEANYGEAIAEALNHIIGLAGLSIEICGAWVWVSGETKQHRDVLKAAGFKWASKKQVWYYRPASQRSFSRGKLSLTDIRQKYGSKTVKKERRALACG